MPHVEVRGTVRDDGGAPVVGALVMGADLGWAETAADGSFIVHNPELALFVWCTGYYPCTHVLRANHQGPVELRVRAIRMKPAARHADN